MLLKINEMQDESLITLKEMVASNCRAALSVASSGSLLILGLVGAGAVIGFGLRSFPVGSSESLMERRIHISRKTGLKSSQRIDIIADS